ncbi:MAG TPA: hypothetical protein VLX68_01840 [Chitinivibrionales bacterium]|nr:hypothetical protein [Chitinivibrionales bacterium]
MKKLLLFIPAVALCQLLVSCDNGWLYKPTQFIVPAPPPPKRGFISGDSLAKFCGLKDVILLYNWSIQGEMTPTLYYVNFSDSNPTPIQMKKPVGREDWYANSPMPSPDGKLVAYYVFQGAQCEAYVQQLDPAAVPILVASPGSDPHFYKDPQGNLWVTYANITGILTGSLTSDSSYVTYKQQVNAINGQKIGLPDTLVHLPFYGGISKDGRYLCTGYAGAYIYDFSDSSLHAINSGVQTCNPSISTDSILTDRMMFLNFPGPQNINNFPTTSVGEHKMVFIVDKSNSLVNAFNVNTVLDASVVEWQCPEWSNNPDYFAALASQDQVNYDIYLVQISTGKAFRLNIPKEFQVNWSSTPYVFFAGGAS